jgi:CubicO group peptidase (beta-lactamase class C family)
MFLYRMKKHIITILLFAIFLPCCSKNSAQPEDKQTSPYPEAVEQNIDDVQLFFAFVAAANISDMQGLAVARNSIIVAEQYYNDAGPDPDPDLHVMSVTKSITSMLVGIAIDQGFIESVDQTLSDFLEDEVDLINPKLGQVTIHQLLTMTCGHDWHEIGSESEYGFWVNAPDQLDYIYAKPIVNTPGTVFNYSDGAAHLVSAILTKATGMSTYAFAKRNLFDPMGLGNRTWDTDNRNIAYGGVGLHIGIHDMIKFGYLVLNNGVFNGRQIVPSDWLNKATSFQISTNNIVSFLSDYGYFWWLGHAHGHDFICANGYGGQFIFIVRSLNLVVCVRTNYRSRTATQAGDNWYRVLDIIINQILPAVKD